MRQDANPRRSFHWQLVAATLLSFFSRVKSIALTVLVVEGFGRTDSGNGLEARSSPNASRAFKTLEEHGMQTPHVNRTHELRWVTLADEIASTHVGFESSGYESQAWATVKSARKSGSHIQVQRAGSMWGNLLRLLDSSETLRWYFCIVMAILICLDITILQQLPETPRFHIILALLWLVVAIGIGLQVWADSGAQAGMQWFTGYLLELILSLDNVFIVHLIFSTLQTPRRLMGKALFIVLLGSIAFRFVLIIGLASWLDRLRVIPYALGMWLLYCGFKQVNMNEYESSDVTQSAVVRALRALLRDRLGDFYDEDREAVVMVSEKGRHCITYLGVVVFCLLAADFSFGIDVVMTKTEEIPDMCLNFSSSAVALFELRALFFVASDIFSRFSFTKYGSGLVLIFVGAEKLLAGTVYVNALASCAIVALITVVSMAVPSLNDSGSKVHV